MPLRTTRFNLACRLAFFFAWVISVGHAVACSTPWDAEGYSLNTFSYSFNNGTAQVGVSGVRVLYPAEQSSFCSHGD